MKIFASIAAAVLMAMTMSSGANALPLTGSAPAIAKVEIDQAVTEVNGRHGFSRHGNFRSGRSFGHRGFSRGFSHRGFGNRGFSRGFGHRNFGNRGFSRGFSHRGFGNRGFSGGFSHRSFGNRGFSRGFSRGHGFR